MRAPGHSAPARAPAIAPETRLVPVRGGARGARSSSGTIDEVRSAASLLSSCWPLLLLSCDGEGVSASRPTDVGARACIAHTDCVGGRCVAGLCQSIVSLDGSASVPDAAPEARADGGSAPDASVLADVGAFDASAMERGDAGRGDAAAALDAAQPIDAGNAAGPVPRGQYEYRRVTLAELPSDRELSSVAVSPDGRALVAGASSGELFFLERAPEAWVRTVRLPLGGLARVRPSALAFDPADGSLLVAATAWSRSGAAEGRLYRVSARGENLTELGVLAGTELVALKLDAGAARWVVAGARTVGGGSGAISFSSFDPSTGALTQLGQAIVGPGCEDGALVADGLGGLGAAYACGRNGGAVGLREGSGAFVSGPAVGNTSRIAARPQRDYALAVTWSANRLLRYAQGEWSVGAAALDLGARGAYEVGFSDDGRRALIIGQYREDTGLATVLEYRHELFAMDALTDVSIPAFDAPPWQAASGVMLHQAAFVPGTDCGYIVGGCSAGGCLHGYLVAFRILNGRGC